MKRICIICAAVTALLSCNGKTSQTTGEASQASDTIPFQEKYRPQIHFSPAEHWMNDPNGMVYYEGEYHLFYQYYPEASHWGPMHWGHAVSKDLMHWEHLPIAIYPDSLGYIFSGSAVVDWNNTTGFGSKENPPLIAMFTYHNPEIEKAQKIEVESQGIAYSTDKGRTWTKYDLNPVIPNPGIRDFRDPKLFWHETTKQWIVVLAGGQEVCFYASPDCKNWKFLSKFGNGFGCHDGVWECPDMFPLRVNGTDEEKWVLIVNINPGGPAGGSATQYFVGDFDGKHFTGSHKQTLWMDQGHDNYAGVTWSDAPEHRRILIGWMNNWQYAGEKPCIKWSGATTIPRELGLTKDGELYLLTSEPVREVQTLYGKSVAFNKLKVNGTEALSDKLDFAKAPIEIKLTFDLNAQPDCYGISLKNKKGEYITISYDNIKKVFHIDRTNATGEVFSDKFASLHSFPFVADAKTIEWTLLIDVASVEFFTAEGRIVDTEVFYPSEPFDIIEIFSENGTLEVSEGKITELHSIWKK